MSTKSQLPTSPPIPPVNVARGLGVVFTVAMLGAAAATGIAFAATPKAAESVRPLTINNVYRITGRNARVILIAENSDRALNREARERDRETAREESRMQRQGEADERRAISRERHDSRPRYDR